MTTTTLGTQLSINNIVKSEAVDKGTADLPDGYRWAEVGETNTFNVIVDSASPIISINGDNPAYHQVGTNYTDAEATGSDTGAGGAVNVTADNQVNKDIVGDYNVVYTADDGAGNTSSATRLVHVVKSPDKTVAAIAAGMTLVDAKTLVAADTRLDEAIVAFPTSARASRFASVTNATERLEKTAKLAHTAVGHHPTDMQCEVDSLHPH